METFSALLALCAGNSPVLVKSPRKGQWRGALMFSLICTWISDWVNNREAVDLRHHRGHCDVNVMIYICGNIYYKQILYVMQHMYLNQDNRVNKTHMKLLLECFILLSHFVNVGSQFMDCDGVFQEVFVLVDWLLVCWCSNFRNFLIRVQFQVFFSGVWNCITYAQNSQPCFHE